MVLFRKGSRVRWKWGKGEGEGKIAERFTSDVERTIKGAKIKRNASPEEPAYLIDLDDGGTVMKSLSELTKT